MKIVVSFSFKALYTKKEIFFCSQSVNWCFICSGSLKSGLAVNDLMIHQLDKKKCFESDSNNNVLLCCYCYSCGVGYHILIVLEQLLKLYSNRFVLGLNKPLVKNNNTDKISSCQHSNTCTYNIKTHVSWVFCMINVRSCLCREFQISHLWGSI